MIRWGGGKFRIANSRPFHPRSACDGNGTILGAVAVLPTAVDSLSHAYDFGFVTCGDDTRIRCLGVDPKWLAEYGAISQNGRRDGRSSVATGLSRFGDYCRRTLRPCCGRTIGSFCSRCLTGLDVRLFRRWPVRNHCLRVLLDIVEDRLALRFNLLSSDAMPDRERQKVDLSA